MEYETYGDKIFSMRMETNQYLIKTEHYLKDLSPSDKANIILEIQDHLNKQVSEFPKKDIQIIISELGSPQSVANKYRRQKGISDFKENKPFSFFKFIFSISVILFTIFVIAIGLLIWNFTPIFKIDENSNRITILGGLIDVNGKSGKVKFMDHYQFTDNNFTNSFEGSIDIIEENYDELVVNFKSGTLNLTYNEQNQVNWNCKLDSPPQEDFVNRSEEIVELDFEELDGISCDISAPTRFKTTVDATDGRVTILGPLNDTFVELTNGDIIFRPNPELDYKYELDATRLDINTFESSTAKDAIEINLTTKNGDLIRQ